MTNEKILEIKNELVNQGIIKPMIDDSKFLKVFEELKEWFKWDIQRFPYKELIDPIGYRYNYKDCDLKFGNCSWEFDENVSKNFEKEMKSYHEKTYHEVDEVVAILDKTYEIVKILDMDK